MYMKEDYFLAKWLLSKDFEVDATVEAIKEDLEWRERHKIDTILEEDWEDMRKLFPYSRDTFDREGRPVMYMDVSDWDTAGYLAEGEAASKRFLRYMIMYGEEGDDHVRRLRAQGKNVTQFSMLFNLAEYSTRKHACLQCLWVTRESSAITGPHYPYSVESIRLVNAPLIFKGVFLLVSPLIQKELAVYGQDREQWETMLLDIMDKDQFPAKLLEHAEPPQKDNSEGWLPWKLEL